MVLPDGWKTKLEDGDPEEIIRTLKLLHLSGMSTAFEEQKSSLSSYGEMPFNQRLGLICAREIEQRENSALQKRLKDARLLNPYACMENVDTRASREMNKELLYQLRTCDFIKEKRHVSFEGATGTGKTYLASALGNIACRRGYKVRCVRLADLLNEMVIARTRGETSKVRNTYTKYDLLIIDEWLMFPLGASNSFELLDLIDNCYGKSSIIFCSQYPHSEWYNRIDTDRPGGSESTLAEAILDRIIHHMDVIAITSKESMRKHYNFDGDSTTK